MEQGHSGNNRQNTNPEEKELTPAEKILEKASIIFCFGTLLMLFLKVVFF